MLSNDILRRIRYTFDYSDTKMIEIFRLGGLKATRAELATWLLREGEPDIVECEDVQLASFLNGLIILNRGLKDGVQPVPEKRLTNNMILMKLKIALNLKADDVLEIIELAEFRVSKHELSAFFRKPGHKHYRECLDQFLRYFLNGMKLKYRDKVVLKKPDESKKVT
jgi:uncharacterized protein YehS (DUF1456 family)